VIAVRLLADGAVVREAVFRDGAVVIGRGPESDFVVFDKSVSRRHALVCADESGEVWIADTESRNGLRVGGRLVPRARLDVSGPLRCRLGGAEVELALHSGDVTEEMAVDTVRSPMSALKAAGLWAASVAAGAAALLIDPSFWSPWEPDRLTSLFQLTLGVAVGLPVVAFVLIGLLRIAGRKARVSDALRTLAFVSWGWVFLTIFVAAASYALSVQAHAALAALLQKGATVLTIASLASIARPGPRLRFFAAWAAAVAVVMAGFGAIGALAARQAGMPELDYDVVPPILGRAGTAADLDGYLHAVGEDFATAEERAADERRRSEAEPQGPSR
jgi:pSer/pThr/pTyr-binding forkhead associated (FHA) protein